MPRISLRDVQKNYGRGSVNAVSDLNLEVGDGEFLCLLGPSGCGKTTTLRMIAGLEHPSGGEITVGDRTVDSVSKGIYVPPEDREMGLVFQSYALWPHLTIEKNVDFGLRLRRIPRKDRELRTTDVMTTLGIEKYRDRYPSELSGGQQQRVALARMLAVSPKVLLLDEPLSNLDARLRLEMRAELLRLHRQFNTTIVFVTHDQWEAMTLATTIAVMGEGCLQQLGTPDDVYDRPANRFVAEFVGNSPINIIELGDESSSALSGMALTYLGPRFRQLGELGSVGIRPESLRLVSGEQSVRASAFSGAARVTGVLPTGGSWIVELAVGEEKVFTITSELPRVRPGDTTYFWVHDTDLHLFARDGHRSEQADRVLAGAR